MTLRDKIEAKVSAYRYGNNGMTASETSDAILDVIRADYDKCLDAANEYISKQYGISALGNPIDRSRILSALGIDQ